MRTKNELIKYLFGKGYIDLDEALELASGPKTDVSEQKLMYEGAQRSLAIAKIVSSIIDKHVEQDPDTGETFLASLDLDKCVNTMHYLNHEWFNYKTGKKEEVSKETLKETLRSAIRDCIGEFIDRYKNGHLNDGYWSKEIGGYIVETRFKDEAQTKIVTEVIYAPIRNTSDPIEISQLL